MVTAAALNVDEADVSLHRNFVFACFIFGGWRSLPQAFMKVLIPSALRSYTESAYAEASGATLAAVVADLDRLYPGIRFRMIDEQNRIRPHIRFFANGAQVRDLSQALGGSEELVIVQALSGG